MDSVSTLSQDSKSNLLGPNSTDQGTDDQNLHKETDSIVQRLEKFRKSSQNEWHSKRLSNSQWEFWPKMANFLFQQLSPILSEKDQQFSILLSIDSCLKVTIANARKFILEETHQFSKVFEEAEATETSILHLKLTVYPTTLPEVLNSWKSQFALTRKFLKFLVQFVESKGLKVTLRSLGAQLKLQLLINNIRLSFQCMAPARKRPLISVEFVSSQNWVWKKILLSEANFLHAMSEICNGICGQNHPMYHYHCLDKLGRNNELMGSPVVEQSLKWPQPQMELYSELLELLKGKNFNLTSSPNGLQFTVTPKEPFSLLAKLFGRVMTPVDREVCQQSLDSFLTITWPDKSIISQCILNETHQLKGHGLKRQAKIEFVEIASFEAIVRKVFKIVNSWQPQFDLVDEFVTKLAQFLMDSQISVQLKPLKIHLKDLTLEIEDISIRCNFIPVCYERPLIEVDVFGTVVSYRIKDSSSMEKLFRFLKSLIGNEQKCPPLGRKRKIVRTKSKVGRKKRCKKTEEPKRFRTVETKEPNSSLPEMIRELKTILMKPSSDLMTEFEDARSVFMRHLMSCRENGHVVTIESGPGLETVEARHKNTKLIVEFQELKDKVCWKLRLSPVAHPEAGLMAKGSSPVFYQSLVVCLQQFFELKQEDFIVVEVEVDSDALETGEVSLEEKYLPTCSIVKENVE